MFFLLFLLDNVRILTRAIAESRSIARTFGSGSGRPKNIRIWFLYSLQEDTSAESHRE
jgi:hypothetical protein